MNKRARKHCCDDEGAMLDRVQHDSFRYFIERCNPCNGLIADSTQPKSPCSIGVVGFALSCYPVGVAHGWMTRAQAQQRVLTTLRFFHTADQSGAPDAVGYKGFFYHFLDMQSGQRAWQSELSTIDTALLVAGMLTCAQFFDRDNKAECEIRATAHAIYERIDWRWAQNGGCAVSMAWKPERGFLRSRWIGYNEGLILYALALGSPSHAATIDAYAQWLSGYRWKRIYDIEYVYAGPLFIHQFSHAWIDFRNIQDRYMARAKMDYFENSRRATYVHHAYAQRNPRGFAHFDARCWGLTASDGPGPGTRMLQGRKRVLHGYLARGAPFGADDGTVAPWAALSSIPFAPEIVVPTLHYLYDQTYNVRNEFGFYASFNPTIDRHRGNVGWISPLHFGLHQGPIVLMIENYRNGMIWRLLRDCIPIIRGLRRAGFQGGWLDHAVE